MNFSLESPLASQVIDNRYKHILTHLRPFLVTFPDNLSSFDLNPWGYEVPRDFIFSCLSSKNERFFDLLHTLDDLAFGPMGLPADKWIFFDCAEMPGGVFGFGIPGNQLPEKMLKRFDLPSNYTGLVPLSMYLAIPMVQRGSWFAHNLASLNHLLRPQFPGLGLLTKVMGLKVFQTQTLYGATQWDSKSMHIHLQIGNMNLLSAYTPAHTIKRSLSYKTPIQDDLLLKALQGIPRKAIQWDQLIPSDDEQSFIKIQQALEEGRQMQLVGRPLKKEGKTFFPAANLKH
jgi:hypothetical protein